MGAELRFDFVDGRIEEGKMEEMEKFDEVLSNTGL